MTELRLLPIVIIGCAGLLVLKLLAVMDGPKARYFGPQMAMAQVVPDSFRALAMASQSDADIVTGSAPPKKETPEGEDKKKPDTKTSPAEGRLIITDPPKEPIPASERAILERLQARRLEIEARGKEMDMRESELRALEKRVEERANQLKELENSINMSVQKRDEVESQRVKNVVVMYEAMRPKDAARIFDELDLSVQLEVAMFMKPAKLSDILAAMRSDTAKRLTTELARRPTRNAEAMQPGSFSSMINQAPDNLPKIDGKPKM